VGIQMTKEEMLAGIDVQRQQVSNQFLVDNGMPPGDRAPVMPGADVWRERFPDYNENNAPSCAPIGQCMNHMAQDPECNIEQIVSFDQSGFDLAFEDPDPIIPTASM